MAGEYLPPVTTTFRADIGDFIAKVEAAKAAIDSLDSKRVEISASVSGIAGPVAGAIAQITALKAALAGLGDQAITITTDVHGAGAAVAATGAASVAAANQGGRFTGWLFLAHNLLTIFGANLAADLIGIVAFSAGAVQAFQPIISNWSKMATSFGLLDNFQRTAVVSLNNFINSLTHANEAGIFTVFNNGLALVEQLMGRGSGIVSQATMAFNSFINMLRNDFTSSQWQQLFSRNSNVIQTDLTALFHLISNLINLLPALFHDFNTLGLGFINGAAALIRLATIIGDSNPMLVRFASIGFLAYRAWQWLAGSALATGAGALVKGISRVTEAISVLGLSGGIEYITGLGAAALVTGGAFAVMGGALIAAIVIGNADAGRSITDLIASLQQQDHAVGDNLSGYIKLKNSLDSYLNDIPKALGMNRQLAVNTRAIGMDTLAAAGAIEQARNQASTAVNNFRYLMNTYHLTAAQAYALAQATHTSMTSTDLMSKSASGARQNIAQYVATVKAAQNPLTQLQFDMQNAANATLDMQNRVQALAGAFNALLGPWATALQDAVTWSQNNRTLEQAVRASNGVVRAFGTTLQQTSAQDLAQAIQSTINYSNAQANIPGHMARAIQVIGQEIRILESLHSKSDVVRQAIKLLQQQLDALHSKSVTLTVGTNFVYSGTPPPNYFQKPGSSLFPAASGAGTASTSINIRSSTATNQQLARALQRTVNQKTIRNGSTQTFIAGRLH